MTRKREARSDGQFVLKFGGGINEQAPYAMDPNECEEGYNFRLDNIAKTFKPRSPMDLEGTAPNAGTITGIVQLIKQDGTASQIVASDTVVYDWDGADTFSAVTPAGYTSGGKLRGVTWQLDDIAVITDLALNNPLYQWDGAAVSVLSHGLEPVTLKAKYGAVFNSRVWLGHVKADSTEYPHMLLASGFEQPTVYNNAVRAKSSGISALDPFYILSPNGKPINGVTEFFGKLLFSTEGGKLYVLSGSDATDYQIDDFYAGSAAEGAESMVSIGNDLVYFRRGGVVESLRATEKYGDVAADDISRWVKDTAKTMTDPIAVYDPTEQLVYFFDSALSGALVLDKTALFSGQLSPWTKYTTLLSNNLATQAALYMKDPTSSSRYAVYWGDASGNIYTFEGSGLNGDGGSANIDVYRRTGFIQQPNTTDEILAGRVEYQRAGAANLEMTFDWAEAFNKYTATLSLQGAITRGTPHFWGGDAYWGGDFYWNAGVVQESQLSSAGFAVPAEGPGFFLDLRASQKTSFQVTQIYV